MNVEQAPGQIQYPVLPNTRASVEDGLARQIDAELAHKLMQLGVREYLVPPVTDPTLRKLVDFFQRHAKNSPKPHHVAALYTFFPGKPEVGTTTIALGTSCALAEDLSVSTLLLDCDLAAVSGQLTAAAAGSLD